MILFVLVTKFLVATGEDYDGNNIRKSEIIDLSYDGAGNQCFDWADYPLDVSRATGGLIEDQVVICGGQNLGGSGSSDCYSISGYTSTFITKMSVKRHSESKIFRGAKLFICQGKNEAKHCRTDKFGRTYELKGDQNLPSL